MDVARPLFHRTLGEPTFLCSRPGLRRMQYYLLCGRCGVLPSAVLHYDLSSSSLQWLEEVLPTNNESLKALEMQCRAPAAFSGLGSTTTGSGHLQSRLQSTIKGLSFEFVILWFGMTLVCPSDRRVESSCEQGQLRVGHKQLW